MSREAERRALEQMRWEKQERARRKPAPRFLWALYMVIVIVAVVFEFIRYFTNFFKD